MASTIIHMVREIARTVQRTDYFSSHTGTVYLTKEKAQNSGIEFYHIQVVDAVTLSHFNDAPIGSTLFCRANGLYARKTGATTWELIGGSAGAIADPGDAGAIAVVGSGRVPIVTAGAETRTLAIPTYAGQEITLELKTDGGNAVITTASGANQTGNNTLTMADAGDVIKLQAIENGAALAWRIVHNDGVALSTV